MRFAPALTAALWLPHAQGDARFFVFAFFVGSIVLLLKGLEA